MFEPPETSERFRLNRAALAGVGQVGSIPFSAASDLYPRGANA